MHVNGGCHVGNIQYEAKVDPSAVSICHGPDCQRLTGTAYRANVRVDKHTEAADFKPSDGKPSIYAKTAEGGAKRARAFCPLRGTPFYSTTPDPQPQAYGLRVGALQQRVQWPPRRQDWCRSALPRSGNIGGLPKTAMQLQR